MQLPIRFVVRRGGHGAGEDRDQSSGAGRVAIYLKALDPAGDGQLLPIVPENLKRLREYDSP